jgi:hypothetical protein
VYKQEICGADFSLPSKLIGLVTWPEKTFELKQILLLNKEKDFFKFVNNVRFKQHRTTERVSYFSIGQRILKGHGNEADFLGFLHKSVWHMSLTLHFEPF